MKHDSDRLLNGSLTDLTVPVADSRSGMRNQVALHEGHLKLGNSSGWDLVAEIAEPPLNRFLLSRDALVFAPLKDNESNPTIVNLGSGPNGILRVAGRTATTLNTSQRHDENSSCLRIVNNGRIEILLPSNLQAGVGYTMGFAYRPDAAVQAGYNSGIIGLYPPALGPGGRFGIVGSHTISAGMMTCSYTTSSNSSRAFDIAHGHWNFIVMSLSSDRQIVRCNNVVHNSARNPQLILDLTSRLFSLGADVSNYGNRSLVGSVRNAFLLPQALTVEEMEELVPMM